MATNLKFREWLEYVKVHIRPDFEAGEIYWAIRMKGRRVNKPLGCKDTNGYIKTQIAGKARYVHQIIFFLYNGYWAALIDHDDRNPSNNKPLNLLDSNHSNNALNTKTWKTNTSGVKGASITPSGTYKVTKQGRHLGTFKTREEAENAYNKHC